MDKTTPACDAKSACVLHDEEIEAAESVFQMLACGSRLKILFVLWQHGSMSVCKLADMVGLSVSAVSHQLRHLRDRRLVRCRCEGNMAFYSLGDDPCLPRLLRLAVCIGKGLPDLDDGGGAPGEAGAKA